MKKILLIGELNKAIENLNETLILDFQVQVCSMGTEEIKVMLQIAKPDLIIVSLIGSYEINEAIFKLLAEQRIKIPILTIGTERECAQYSQYYETKQFEALYRPILKRVLLERCYSILGLSENNKKQEVYEWYNKKQKKSIMVVDDSSLVLRNIKSMLEPRYTVYVANSGKQALKFIPEKKPDMILLDYEMPKMDGRQTLEKIREMEEWKDIPVVFLTGVADRQHIYAVLQLEPAGYILKPPSVDKILEVIEEALGE